MPKLQTRFFYGTALLAALSPSLVFGNSAGNLAGRSGAPGDDVCSSCHTGAPSSQGKVEFKLSNPDGRYVPGQTQRVTVTITDPDARRWGFQASPRLVSSPRTALGGTLASVDANTRVLSDTNPTLQWVGHTSAGTRPGTTGPITFLFDWTPPATDVGDVDFYVAANAANNNGTSGSGDRNYNTTVRISPALTAPGGLKPAISAGGVVNGASFADVGIVSGSWVTIKGSNLASTTRIWDSSKEIVNGKLPTSLDGTSVKINGKDAAVYFISPRQLNVQAPSDTARGTVQVQVTTPNGTSDTFSANIVATAPALFLFEQGPGTYAAAVISDGTYLGPAGLFGTALTSRPARPGETVLLFGTGFGDTNPGVPSGQVVSTAVPLTRTAQVFVGNVGKEVLGYLVGSGLYQFNILIDDRIPDGDQPVRITINGQETPTGVFISIKR